MCDCCKNIRWGKVFIAGILFAVISLIVRQAEVFFTMDFYKMSDYFTVWSKLMMPKAGPPPTSFILTSIFFSFVTGVILAAFYDSSKTIMCKGYWQRITCFTISITSLAFVLFTLPVYLMINLPIALLIWWFITSVVIFFLSAIAFEKVLK